MNKQSSLSSPYVQHLFQLLKEISDGHIQIPKFQRSFLWTNEKRIELLRSIRDGIPIGSILLWRTDIKTLESAIRLGPHDLPKPKSAQATERTYLLDGMQRLSTLYGCLWPLPKDTTPFLTDENGDLQSWLVCYDLRKEDFEIAESGNIPSTWLPLTALLDSVRLIQFQRKLGEHTDAEDLIRRADALAETFRGYMLPVIPISTDSLADATRTFQRINSQGTRMSELHMVRALTWGSNFDLEESLERATSELEGEGWESIDPDHILQVCKAALGLDIAVESPDKLSSGFRDHPETIQQVTQSLTLLAKWLRKQGIRSPRLVPYSAQIVMLAEAFRIGGEPSNAISQKLSLWIWQTTYSAYFASISGYRMSTLLEGVRSLARGEEMTWPGGKTPAPKFDLPHRFDARAARIKASSLQLARLNPLDENGVPIGALDLLAGQGPSVMMHIVPLSFGVPGATSIANRTFIGPESNIHLHLLANTSQLKQKILESHLIKQEAAVALIKKDYEQFLRLRKADIEEHERQFFSLAQQVTIEV